MAIGTTPLFSSLSGSVGPIDYRTRRNGKIEIGKKRRPANPQSADQTATRNAYGRLHELWVNADWIDSTQYNNIAAEYNISPWNAFLMRHLPIMRLNPVAYWPFVEGTGTTLHDFTVNENHSTIFGANWSVKGKYDIPELIFDGVDDVIRTPGSTSLANLTDQISATVNVRFTEARDCTFFRTPYNADPNSFGLDITDSRIRAFIYDVSIPYPAERNWIPQTNTNYQLSLDFDGNRVKAIINSTDYTGLDHIGNIDTTDKGVIFGSREWPVETSFFKGIAREIYVFENSLTNNQYANLRVHTNKFYSD